jgi:hypothetical protein
MFARAYIHPGHWQKFALLYRYFVTLSCHACHESVIRNWYAQEALRLELLGGGKGDRRWTSETHILNGSQPVSDMELGDRVKR